ncbi:hypothetical protein SARC_08760 [Sphaeroforma arctica JP610]|uniref:Wax synthase domain-containing protein n=1 Tax=Sphaeroforma arctica JP610 TaxID=667725 RepID=A0A0L0FPT9_9EUKA|nr:hypothetical protein SARC_08760 [Sphaeroforma arctica JP610]KNC78825.1 hypothetical protein SARC_08760 [Sphaeroforma arctica JP610]|eukprot:XP_014152727.1 hypothetical protein SARC_08760 [Sphaeroforma arctica JP610]
MRMTSVHLEVDDDDDKEKDKWKEVSFLMFLQGTLFTLLPYVYIEPKIRKRHKVLVRECMFSLMKAAVYLYVVNTSWIWLMRCLGGGVHQMLVSYTHQVAYSTVFFIHSATVALFHYQMQKGLLPLLTNDTLNVQVTFQDPFLASSAEDFWGHRWGLITRNVLALTVCAPAVKKTESPVVSAMAAFLISGAMHAYTVEVVFGVRAPHAVLFFVLHGVAVSLEKYWTLSGGRRPIRIISTLLWLLFGVLTLPLYFGTLARASPQWLQAYLPDLGLLSLLKIPEFQCY